LRADAVAQLQKHYDVELTYTSNAIRETRWRCERPPRSSSMASPWAA